MKNKYLLFLAITIFWFFLSNTGIAQNCVQCDLTSHPSGTNASTIGISDTASGYCSFAGGYNSNSEGQYSFAFGNDANALGNYSLAFGALSKAKYTGSITLGSYTVSDGYKAIVLGHGQYTHPLVNDVAYSIMMGINSDIPTLFIKSAMGFGYTGRIGIGNVTSPQAKLHIREDDNYDTASVFIQASKTDRPAYLWLGTKDYGLQKQNTSLEFLTDGDYVFSQGNIKLDNHYLIEATRIQSKTSYGLSLVTSYNSGIFIDERGQVGIGNTRPYATLDVTGKIKASYLQIPGTNPKDSLRDLTNYVLKSRDNYGNVTWAPQSSLDDGDWSTNADDELYFNGGNVGIGTYDPGSELEVDGKITAQSIRLSTGAEAGKILRSDANGDATWVDPPQTDDGDWSFGFDNNIFRLNGNVGIGTSTPVEKF